MSRSGALVASVLLGAALLSGPAFAQPRVEYRNRGNRFEGVRALPVSGYTIELLAAQATYKDPVPADTTPAVYRLRFFLDRPESAYVVVREVHNRHSYWLDKLQPPTPWRPGFANLFEWSTKDVLGNLPGLGLYDLGVIVRVGNESPSDLETVAPAVLYHSLLPGSVSGYEFAFKTNAAARLEFSVERSDGSPAEALPEPRRVERWPFGVPLRVTWDAAAAQAGEYRLKVLGRVLQTNQQFGKEVRFFHQPNPPGMSP